MKLILISFVFFSISMAKSDTGSSDEMKFCTMEVKECPDGSFVGRDSKNDCEFKACPKSEQSESKCSVGQTTCTDEKK